MGAPVICDLEMTYAGTKRYKGEIFELTGSIHDDKLVRVGHVRPITSDFEMVEDETGRKFIDETARINYRRSAPEDARIVARRPGRPRKQG